MQARFRPVSTAPFLTLSKIAYTKFSAVPIVTAVQLPKSDYLPFNDNSANMNFAQFWAFLIIIPGEPIIGRKLYRVTKNPYLAGIITGVIVAIISCCNTTSILP